MLVVLPSNTICQSFLFPLLFKEFAPSTQSYELSANSMPEKKTQLKIHQPDLTAQKGKVQNRYHELYPSDVTNHFVLKEKGYKLL